MQFEDDLCLLLRGLVKVSLKLGLSELELLQLNILKSALLRKTREPEHKSCGAGHSKELGFVVSPVKMSLRAARTSLGGS